MQKCKKIIDDKKKRVGFNEINRETGVRERPNFASKIDFP